MNDNDLMGASSNAGQTNVTTPPIVNQNIAQPQIVQDQFPVSEISDFPDELKGWNWGAFFFGWIWGIVSGVWISLLGLIPALNFVMSIVLGIKGNELAWKAKKYASIEDFKILQRKWAIWGFVLFFVTIVAIVATVMYQMTRSMQTVPLDSADDFNSNYSDYDTNLIDEDVDNSSAYDEDSYYSL